MRAKRARQEAEIAKAREEERFAWEGEFATLRARRSEESTRVVQAECDRIRAELTKERDAWTKRQDDIRKQLETERTEFERQKGALSALQSDIEGRKVLLETAERMSERREQRSSSNGTSETNNCLKSLIPVW